MLEEPTPPTHAPATLGTSRAINPPPFKNPPNSGGQLKTPDPTEQNWTWRSCSQEARDVINYMVKITPRGAPKMWRSGPEVSAVERLLQDGIPVEDLVELAEGASVLITAGRQDAQWWYARNVFGPRTLQRWAGDVAAYEADLRAAAERDRELAALEQRAQQEREAARAAPKPKVADLELHRLGAACMAQVRGRSETDHPAPQQVEFGMVESAHGRPPTAVPRAHHERACSPDNRNTGVASLFASEAPDRGFDLALPRLQRFDPGRSRGDEARLRRSRLLDVGGEAGGGQGAGREDAEPAAALVRVEDRHLLKPVASAG